jgi:hypothetical protein
MGATMTDDPYREIRTHDIPPTKPMIVDRPPESGSWIALALAVAVLIAVGYYYLKPDVPSPNMRAEAPIVTPTPK